MCCMSATHPKLHLEAKRSLFRSPEAVAEMSPLRPRRSQRRHYEYEDHEYCNLDLSSTYYFPSWLRSRRSLRRAFKKGQFVISADFGINFRARRFHVALPVGVWLICVIRLVYRVLLRQVFSSLPGVGGSG